MRMAIIGCGYVAELYVRTLRIHPELQLVALFDTEIERALALSRLTGTRVYESLGDLLANDGIELILNLTNPRSHFEVTKACLTAGKHVYSEKPLAMTFQQALELQEMATLLGLGLATAPCSLLSEGAQTLGKALRNRVAGKVRLVYANFEDGMIAPQMAPWTWTNICGVAWPAKDEFEVGCTYEHAGYVLTWLAAFFGPAKRVTSFASVQLPDKGIAVGEMAPDFTSACIEYEDGVVARVTCGLVAPKDKSITVIADNGVLTVGNVRDDACPVYFRSLPLAPRLASLERRINYLSRPLRRLLAIEEFQIRRRLPQVGQPPRVTVGDSKPVDFFRGPAELADSLKTGRACRLSAELGVHIVEIIEAIQYPGRFGGQRVLQSTFAPIEPLH